MRHLMIIGQIIQLPSPCCSLTPLVWLKQTPVRDVRKRGGEPNAAANTREVEALQVRMRRQVSGSEIELHRIARLRDGWAGRGQAQVFEDLLDRGAQSERRS